MLGQWLWHSCRSDSFQYQMTPVQILTPAILSMPLIPLKDENKEIRGRQMTNVFTKLYPLDGYELNFVKYLALNQGS